MSLERARKQAAPDEQSMGWEMHKRSSRRGAVSIRSCSTALPVHARHINTNNSHSSVSSCPSSHLSSLDIPKPKPTQQRSPIQTHTGAPGHIHTSYQLPSTHAHPSHTPQGSQPARPRHCLTPRSQRRRKPGATIGAASSNRTHRQGLSPVGGGGRGRRETRSCELPLSVLRGRCRRWGEAAGQ